MAVTIAGVAAKLDSLAADTRRDIRGVAEDTLPEDPSKTRDMRRVSEKSHDIEGIIYLYGNNVKARA